MIHMNLIAVAERTSSIGSVSQQLHVTNVADVERRVKRKYLTIAAAAVFAFVAFSCVLSIKGVPAALDGILPDSYVSLIGAKSLLLRSRRPLLVRPLQKLLNSKKLWRRLVLLCL